MALQVVEVLNDLISIEDLCVLFGRSQLTILHWRRYSGLPYVKIPGKRKPAIRYRLKNVLEWARQMGKEVNGAVGDIQADHSSAQPTDA